ncbi:MAG: DNA polymerase III subunit gamma/tau [Phycisphaeraceae bacterium]|nr:DNA polymerase III subunit gamma/tau [Phycisphaeraceae bacterium]MCW5753937.1 DNA polymerase III subunit gamma/tau [Phycisphaeraceae bacterium]
MSYTVLARRYRSQDFDAVVGQEPIARTLKNAIAENRVAHAYLFTGTRGVGKTSMARIFAKALNGGTPEIDRAIMTGQDTDVIEIDAASNRSVEEARELIANSIYRPMRGKYKIYIIDEVHMLTREAFNALLKTMEEPPEHVKFILCTTETQKVPATIQSRCQRFDFRTISPALIAKHLDQVVRTEGLKADADLLHAVARLANGSMRDALSLLDRVIAAGKKTLTVELLEELLGLPDRQLISTLIDAIAQADLPAAIRAAQTLLERGISPDQLIESLVERFRDLMILAACGSDTDLVALAEEARAEEAARAARFDPPACAHLIALAEGVQRAMRTSASPRALLDALIVRLALAEKFADIAAIVTGNLPPAPEKSVKKS